MLKLADPGLCPSIVKMVSDGSKFEYEVEIYLGKIADREYYPGSNSRRCAVTVNAHIYDDWHRFGIEASIWNANLTDINRGGQCVDYVADHDGPVYPQLCGKSRKVLDLVAELWRKWHLKTWDRIDAEGKGAVLLLARDGLGLPMQPNAERRTL